MDKFTEACRLANRQWVDSLPADAPPHEFSPAFQEAMRPLLQPEITPVPQKRRRLTKKTIKILVAAAVLLALAIATTVIARTGAQKAEIKQLSDHAEYEIVNPGEAEDVKDMTVGYVPDGFEKTKDYGYIYIYENGDQSFSVEKYQLNSTVYFDTETYESKPIEINGADGEYIQSLNEMKGIVFNDSEYIFMISGNISKEELVKIAQNVK